MWNKILSILTLVKISPRALLNYWKNYFKKIGYLKTIIRSEISFYEGAQLLADSKDVDLYVFLSLMPLPFCIKIEGILAAALRKKGHRVLIITNLSSHRLVRKFHKKIYGNSLIMLENFLLPNLDFSIEKEIDILLNKKNELIEELKKFKYRGTNIGLHVLATLSTDIVHGKIEINQEKLKVIRRMLVRSAHYVDASDRILKKLKPKLIIGVERGFVGTSEIFYASLNNGIKYLQWVACHEPNSLMMKKYTWANCRIHPFSLSEKTWNSSKQKVWSEKNTFDLKNQFERGYKEGLWFKQKFLDILGDHLYETRNELLRSLGLDKNLKTAVIYSHILSDANLFYGEDLFESGFEEWMIETVNAAIECKNLNWVLKIHPANIVRNIKSGYVGEYGEILALKNHFGEVPKFLKIVYPDNPLSPLSFFQGTEYAITVRGTVGIEAPVYGVTTLTAGTGRYSGLGFTVDSKSKEQYLGRIRNLNELPCMSDKSITLAQIFASTLFNLRPARYGNVFQDVFPQPVNHPGHRDLLHLNLNIRDAISDNQIQKMVNYIESEDEDFIDVK